MLLLRRIARAGLAKVLYSPFGLAWLRARELNTASTAYRDTPSPTPPRIISALRLIQSLAPPRGARSGEINTSRSGPEAFYCASADANAYQPVPAELSEGPVIAVGGNVTPDGMGSLLLAIARVQTDWSHAAWRFDLIAKPAWLNGVLLLSTSAPIAPDLVPRVTLSPPLHDKDIDAFVAQALIARESVQ